MILIELIRRAPLSRRHGGRERRCPALTWEGPLGGRHPALPNGSASPFHSSISPFLPISNRDWKLLETPATQTKQSPRPMSNRDKMRGSNEAISSAIYERLKSLWYRNHSTS